MRPAQVCKSTGRAVAALEPRIAVGIAQVWLALGAAALLCVPQLRGSSAWIGWLPFWLVVAPLADLLILRWRALLSLTCVAFASLRRRRLALRRGVSRRPGKLRGARRHRAPGQSGPLLLSGH